LYEGMDPTQAQWRMLSSLFKAKQHVPFFDLAYQVRGTPCVCACFVSATRRQTRYELGRALQVATWTATRLRFGRCVRACVLVFLVPLVFKSCTVCVAVCGGRPQRLAGAVVCQKLWFVRRARGHVFRGTLAGTRVRGQCSCGGGCVTRRPVVCFVGRRL
jgi:hypothetical protein